MVKRGRIPSEMWESFRAMSVDVGRLIPFLQETSCMNVDERKMIALCEIAKKMFEGHKKFVSFLDEFAKPFFQYMGWAKWNRDIVSDLGFALSKRKGKRKDLSKVFDWKPPK